MMRIGIDLGGTTVKAALCREEGTLLHKMNAPTLLGDADGLRADMKALALALCEKEAITPEQVQSIGTVSYTHLTRVLFMDGGNIVEQNEPHAFFTNPKHPRLKDFLSKVL